MHVSVVKGTASATRSLGCDRRRGTIRNAVPNRSQLRRRDATASRSAASWCFGGGGVLPEGDNDRVRRMVERGASRRVDPHTDQSASHDVAGHGGAASPADARSDRNGLRGVARRAGRYGEGVLSRNLHDAGSLALHSVRQANSRSRGGDVDRDVLVAPASDRPAARQQECGCEGKKGRFHVRPQVECGKIVMAFRDQTRNCRGCDLRNDQAKGRRRKTFWIRP